MLCRVPTKDTASEDVKRTLVCSSSDADAEAARELVRQCAREHSTALVISGFENLRSLPEEIIDCSQVLTLTVSNNFNLTDITDYLEMMGLLQRVTLSYNRLTRFPRGLVNLKQLTHVDLSNNQLQAVNRDIHSMQGLEVLLLDNNCITAFPPGILYLRSLKRLSIVNNPLVTEDMQVSQYDDEVVLPEEQQEAACMICQDPIVKPLPVYSFTVVAGCQQVPILYVVCGTKCQRAVAELGDSEAQNFSTLAYD